MRLITLLSGEREQWGGSWWCKHHSEKLSGLRFYFYNDTGGEGGGGETRMQGGKRKWHENVSSALFMDPVEEDGQQLGYVSLPPHACFLLFASKFKKEKFNPPKIY